MLQFDDQVFTNVNVSTLLEELEPYSDRGLFKLLNWLYENQKIESSVTISGQEGFSPLLEETLLDISPDEMENEYDVINFYKNQEVIKEILSNEDEEDEFFNFFTCFINETIYEVIYRKDGVILEVNEDPDTHISHPDE